MINLLVEDARLELATMQPPATGSTTELIFHKVWSLGIEPRSVAH